MAKFNLKEHIAKNKATFFGSLTEGQFSWMTQDTGQQIGSQDENKIPVYMFDDKGKYYYENDYDGYGVFGGKDYYELLDQMNGGAGDREKGIDLAFNKAAVEAGKVLFPALVTDPYKFNYKTHDFTQEAPTDPNQSWYTPEEDDYYDQNDDDEDYNRYGDEDEEELEEGKKSKKYYKDAEADDAEHIEALEKDMKDDKKASKKIKENTKMKISEFKARIREMILAEVEFNIENPSGENSLYDPVYESNFLAELEGMLNEAKDEEIEDVDINVEEPETIDEPSSGISVTQNADADLTGTEKELQDNLEAALEAAKKIGDDKLQQQIGNSLTFFTRQHVVKENLNESMFPMLKKILK